MPATAGDPAERFWTMQRQRRNMNGRKLTGVLLTAALLLAALVVPASATQPNDDDHKLVKWNLPDGFEGTPDADDKGIWPQTLADGSECGGWWQVDAYRYKKTKDIKAVDALIKSETLEGSHQDSHLLDNSVDLGNGNPWKFEKQPDCEGPEEPELSFDAGIGEECGTFWLSVSGDHLPTNQDYYYGLRAEVEGDVVGDVLIKNGGEDTQSFSLAEDSYGGTATVNYYIHAATEWSFIDDGLYGDLKYQSDYPDWEGAEAFRTLTVDTNCRGEGSTDLNIDIVKDWNADDGPFDEDDVEVDLDVSHGDTVSYESGWLQTSSNGQLGWSCPSGEVVVGGGYLSEGEPVDISAPMFPNTSYAHHTTGEGETGWYLRNGGTPQKLKVRVTCVEIDSFEVEETIEGLHDDCSYTAGDVAVELVGENGDAALLVSLENDVTCEQPEEPEPKVEVEYSDWEDGTWECDDETVEQTRTKTTTTTTYSFDEEAWEWVANDPVVETETETRTRELTDDEFEACPEPSFGFTSAEVCTEDLDVVFTVDLSDVTDLDEVDVVVTDASDDTELLSDNFTGDDSRTYDWPSRDDALVQTLIVTASADGVDPVVVELDLDDEALEDCTEDEDEALQTITLDKIWEGDDFDGSDDVEVTFDVNIDGEEVTLADGETSEPFDADADWTFEGENVTGFPDDVCEYETVVSEEDGTITNTVDCAEVESEVEEDKVERISVREDTEVLAETEELARTGAPVFGLLAAGLLALFAGAGTLMTRRRKR